MLKKYTTNTPIEWSDCEDEDGNHYTPERSLLGSGSFAEVRRLLPENAKGLKRMVVLSPIPSSSDLTSEVQKEFTSNFKFFQKRHPIPKPALFFYNRLDDPKTILRTCRLVVRHCLGVHLDKVKISSQQEQLDFFIAIVNSVKELHDDDEVHMDIKFNNMLYNQDLKKVELVDGGRWGKAGEPSQGYINFDESEPDHNKKRIIADFQMRYHWMAPEIFTTELCAKSMDIYALGSMLNSLYQNFTEHHAEINQLIQSCINKMPEQRPAIAELMFGFHELRSRYSSEDAISESETDLLLSSDLEYRRETKNDSPADNQERKKELSRDVNDELSIGAYITASISKSTKPEHNATIQDPVDKVSNGCCCRIS